MKTSLVSILSALLFALVPAEAGTIGYDFGDPARITGSGAGIVYSAPDTNTLGGGVTTGDFALTDNSTSDSSQYGRIVSSINGATLGSSKAAVTSRGTDPGNAMSFTLNIPAGSIVDLSAVSFDYGFYSSLSTAATNEWVLNIIVNGVTTEVGRGGFAHDGGTDYQQPASAAGNVALTGFTGLTNTSVTFHWQLNSTATHTFTSRAHTIDNIQVTAEAAVNPEYPVIQSFTVDDRKVVPNTPVVLSWDVSGADSVTLSTVGTVGASGSATVQPAATTVYTLTASNDAGSVQTPLEVAILPDRPNILLMLVDDWGVTDLSVPFAYDRYDDSGTPLTTNLNILHKTPNLERLASTGMKFTQAYATPKCSSTRATLMTGYHPARTGITFHLAADSTIGNGPNNWRFNGLDATDVTLAHLLAPAQYRTIHCGKWHLGGPGDYAQYPTAVGFDINIGGSNAGSPGNYIATASSGFAISGKPMPNLGHYAGTGMYLTKALTIELNRLMGEAVDDGVPFFGYMAYYGVHDPETTNPDAVGDYSAAINADHKKFCTMVEAIDVSYGAIVDRLEELGIAEETLIIHLGDNGSENPVHRNNQASIPIAPFNDFPMRGMKNDGYQGGSRVPLMISWAKPDPDNPMQQGLPIASGSVEHDVVGIEDIAPTILSVAGVEPPFMDGYDLSPYLRGEAGFQRPQKYLMFYPNGSFPNGQLMWYREGDWKLMYGFQADQFLLFNLAADPTESNNLAASEPARVVRMARAMARELDGKWGNLGKLWPVLAGTYPPRPGTDDPFLLPYGVDGRDAVDTDGDGLTDAAEDADADGLVGATETDSDSGNSDGDNINDGDELSLGLDPLDPNSYFYLHGTMDPDGWLTLTWPSLPGTNFEIRGSGDIADWSEIVVPNVPAENPGSSTSYELPPSAEPRKFFRIELK